MYVMPEEITDQSEPAQEAVPVSVATAAPAAEKVAPKKRGRKPKVPSPPTPVPTPVVAHKPKKRRTPEARLSKGERAVAAAISAAQVDRVKCIEELSKVMQMKYAKDGVLQTLDWKIGMLTGDPAPAQAPGYPIPPQYPQPPAYPTPAHAFVPPSMRTPALPNVPQASGGAIEGIVDPDENLDEDQFLKGGGGVIGGKGWV